MLTHDELLRLFHYDPETGVFTRKVKTPGRGRANETVGSADLYGYKTVRINRKSYKLHRLAWLYCKGEWPKGDIDHINGQRSDNRIANLRDVDRATNLQNMRSPKHNKSTGVLGVYPSRNGKRFEAKISISNKSRGLGCFDTIEQAQAAYFAAKQSLHAGFVPSNFAR